MICWDIGTGVTKFQRTELQNILGKEGKFLICERHNSKFLTNLNFPPQLFSIYKGIDGLFCLVLQNCDPTGRCNLGRSGQNKSSFPTYGEGKCHYFLKILDSEGRNFGSFTKKNIVLISLVICTKMKCKI